MGSAGVRKGIAGRGNAGKGRGEREHPEARVAGAG